MPTHSIRTLLSCDFHSTCEGSSSSNPSNSKGSMHRYAHCVLLSDQWTQFTKSMLPKLSFRSSQCCPHTVHAANSANDTIPNHAPVAKL